MHSWRVLILPYLEGNDTYKQYDFDEPWDGPRNRKLEGLMFRIYALHGDWKPGLTTTNYTVVVGDETGFPHDCALAEGDLKGQLSRTIMIAENRGANIHWMEPRDLRFADMEFTINSPQGISSKYDEPAVVMFDGSVRRLSKHISPETLRVLLTVGGKERLREQGEGGWELLPDGRDRPLADQ